MLTRLLRTQRIREAVELWAGLLVIVALNLFLRGILEHGESGVRAYLLGRVDLDPVLQAAPWRLLLPLQELNDGAWGTTGFVLLFFLEKYVGPGITYLIFNALLIIVVFWTSWFAFHSRIFSFTLALCIGFSTFNYHIYSVPGSNVIYPHLMFLAILMLSHFKVVQAEHIVSWWGALSLVALICYALSYEGWIAYSVFVVLAGLVSGVTLWRLHQYSRVRCTVLVMFQTVVATGLYVLVRTRVPTTFRFGSEADLILNYKNLAPAADDFISNFFTYFYLTVSNLLPPSFGFSYALQHFGHIGDREVGRLIGDYHSAFHYLVYPNYLFMWRYYAGVMATVFAYILVRMIRSALRTGSLSAMGVAVFMLLAITTSPGHLLIKFRPYNAIPFLSYKTPSSVLGLYCLVAFLAMTFAKRFEHRRREVWLGVGALWGYVVYLGLARPRILTLMSMQTQMGVYPDPARTLAGWLRSFLRLIY
jgi:hypothetical protein